MPGGNPFVSQVSLNGITMLSGSIDPNGTVSAPIGSIYVRSSPAQIFQNTDGATAWGTVGEQTSEWYNVGLALAGGAAGVIRDPLGLASGPPTYDPVTGGITVPLNTGIIAATPATGWSVTIPAKTDLLKDPRATATFLRGALRAWLTAWAGTPGVLRCGICVMNGPDPTTASGWSIGSYKNASATLDGCLLAWGVAGAWTTFNANTGLVNPHEGTAYQTNSLTNSPVATVRLDSSSGLTNADGDNNLMNVSPRISAGSRRSPTLTPRTSRG